MAMIPRRETRAVFKGDVQVGGGAPVTVQSMTTTHTEDVAGTVGQIGELAELGCQIIRVAVPTLDAARAIGHIRAQIGLPLVADIHFDHRLALASIGQGADCIRINPGNLRSRDDVAEVVRAARDAGISIRVGVNSGSVRERKGLEIADRGGDLAGLMVEAAREHCAMIESLGFGDVVVSLKASDVPTTLAANRAFAEQTDYPLHLGVTEAGTAATGTVKSAVGIGTLLAEGIGDTIRVSLTGRPHDEVRVGHEILRSLGLEHRGIEIVSCPTCGRCEIDLARLVDEVRRKLPPTEQPLTVAVMGCVVNGPGEAAEADVGIAGGKGFGFLFRGGKKLRKVPEGRLADALVREIESMLHDRAEDTA
ncbi:MAG: flavodoxin-dependent (E)-4-hydroxy-3-methylbut-2-enyl-diphosphate synthase [Planctomycetota bacterium]